MKVYTMNELLDRDLGPVGTTERDDFEKKVSDDIHAYHVGEAIRKARLSRHLTQEQLGEKVGVQRSQISRLEKGSSITFSTLIRILRALGISASLDMKGIGDWTMNDLRSVFRRHPKVRKVILFGSRAKGNFRTGSDIDLALVGEDIDHEELLRIYNDIDDLGLLYKVDLLHYEEKQGTPIGEPIDRAGKVFYQQ